MRIGYLSVLALMLVATIALGIAREYAPTNKICKVTYNDNTVATYECRYVDVHRNYIVVSTKDGNVNIPMSCVKMFTTKEWVASDREEGGEVKIKLWMARNEHSGEFLCEGNPNPDLSYHLSYPFDCGYLCHTDWLMCRTKWEIEEHIRKWHRETRLAKQTRCRAVKMIVSWKLEKEGGNE